MKRKKNEEKERLLMLHLKKCRVEEMTVTLGAKPETRYVVSFSLTGVEVSAFLAAMFNNIHYEHGHALQELLLSALKQANIKL